MLVWRNVSVNRGAGSAPKRGYRSPLREQNARRTRRAVVTAATRLFARARVRGHVTGGHRRGGRRGPAHGGRGVRSKPALLREVIDQATAGDDEPVPVAERPWFRPVWQAVTPGAAVDAYAQVCKSRSTAARRG